MGVRCLLTLSSWLPSIVLLASLTKWPYLFNDDPDVASIVSTVLPIIALSLVFDGVNCIGAGILRARAMQLVGVLLNLRWVMFVWRSKRRH